MNTTNKRSLSGLSTGYYNYLDVEGNIYLNGTLSGSQDISSLTFLGEPNSYFTGITSNIQQQLNTLSYNQLLTISSSLSSIQTISGNINVYYSSYVQPQLNSLSGYIYLHTNQLNTLSSVINTISSYLPYYSNNLQSQITSISGVVNTLSNFIITYTNNYIEPQIMSLSGILNTNSNQITAIYSYLSSVADNLHSLESEAQTISSSLGYYALSSTLNNYTLSSRLINYTLSSSLVNYTLSSSLVNYTLSSSLVNYTLSSSLVNYTLSSSLINYTLSSSLVNYTLSSSLINYTLSSSLVNYTLSSRLINYTLSSSLINYTLSSSLINYTLSSSLINYTLSSSLGTILSNYTLSSTLSLYATNFALSQYVQTPTLASYALTSTLAANYTPLTSLNNLANYAASTYAPLTLLANYTLSSSVGNYSLANYTLSSSLINYTLSSSINSLVSSVNTISSNISNLSTYTLTLSSYLYNILPAPFSIGTVTTLDYGNSAYVTLSNTIFNFGIITGPQGSQGSVGKSGNAQADAALVISILTAGLTTIAGVGAAIYNASIFATLQGEIDTNKNDIAGIKTTLTSIYYTPSAYQNDGAQGEGGVAPGNGTPLTYILGDFGLFANKHNYYHSHPVLYYTSATDSIKFTYCQFGDVNLTCNYNFYDQITVNSVTGNLGLYINATTKMTQIYTELQVINNTASPSITLFDINPTTGMTTINTQLTLIGPIVNTLTIVNTTTNTTNFLLNPNTGTFYINTTPLIIDTLYNITLSGASFSVNSQSALLAQQNFGTGTSSYIKCNTSTDGAILSFQASNCPRQYSNQISSSYSTANSTGTLLVQAEVFTVRNPTTANNPLSISNDALTTSCSQYNLNTTTFNTPFTFTGGTGSNILFTGNTFEFYNANMIPGLQVQASQYFPFVINGNVAINGNLTVVGSIGKEINNTPINQALVQQFRQILQNQLRGIPNI